MSEETRGGRRGILKVGLASVAGIVAGHSILKTDALAAEAEEVTVRISHVSKGGHYKREMLEAIAPVVTKIAESGGRRLTPQEETQLKNNLLQRGEINVPFRDSDPYVQVTVK